MQSVFAASHRRVVAMRQQRNERGTAGFPTTTSDSLAFSRTIGHGLRGYQGESDTRLPLSSTTALLCFMDGVMRIPQRVLGRASLLAHQNVIEIGRLAAVSRLSMAADHLIPSGRKQSFSP